MVVPLPFGFGFGWIVNVLSWATISLNLMGGTRYLIAKNSPNTLCPYRMDNRVHSSHWKEYRCRHTFCSHQSSLSHDNEDNHPYSFH